MKKIAIIALLSISVSAIAVANVHSPKSNLAYANSTSIVDTTPKTTHHTTSKSSSSSSSSKSKSKSKKPAHDSTTKK